jgi:hypothetical protein
MGKTIKIAAGIIVIGIFAVYFSLQNFSTFSVSGAIRDAVTNEPIMGAEVILDQNTIVTMEKGAYELKEIRKGFHSFRVRKSGYQTVTELLNMEDDLKKDVLLVKTK